MMLSYYPAGDEQQQGFAGPSSRRNVFMGELKQMGIKAPDQIATPSVRNDSAFLFTVVGEWRLQNMLQAVEFC
jgi:hypothetical protein